MDGEKMGSCLNLWEMQQTRLFGAISILDERTTRMNKMSKEIFVGEGAVAW